MTTLITGATGFLGGALVRQMLINNENVLATGRDPGKAALLKAAGIPFVQADLSTDDLQPLLNGMDRVIHCAARSSVWGTREQFWTANVHATERLAEAALRADVKRFVHISSPSIYFRFKHQENIEEEHPLPPRFVNTYTASKYAAEQTIQQAVNRGLPALILRPRAIYGPGDTAIFPRILRAMESGKLRVIGDGRTRCDLTWIGNAVEACLKALQADVPLTGRAYNITDGEPVELWPLLTHIAQQLQLSVPTGKVPAKLMRQVAKGLELIHRGFSLNSEPMLTAYGVGLLSYTCTLSIERAKEELNYRPTTTSQEGIEQFLSWWKKQ